MTKLDFIVAGGGIIGMSTARELAIRGASVALIDKGELGKEASWAAGGILSSMRPWMENPASAELSEQGKLLYPQYLNKDEFPSFQDLINKNIDWLADAAKELLKETSETNSFVHPDVHAWWKKLVEMKEEKERKQQGNRWGKTNVTVR